MNTSAPAIVTSPRRPVRQFLDLSTAHLRPTTRAMWTECFCPRSFLVTALFGEHGWMIHVPETNNDWDYRGGTEMFAAFDLARKFGCEYILFDADAPTFTELPTFEDQPQTA
jgi:hypothetical protein